MYNNHPKTSLTVGLSHTLDLILLFDRVAVTTNNTKLASVTKSPLNQITETPRAYYPIMTTRKMLHTHTLSVEHHTPVRRTLRSIDQLVSQALRNRLDVPEGGLSGTSCQQVDSLVYPPQRGNIHGLSPDNSSGSDTCSILTRSTALTP